MLDLLDQLLATWVMAAFWAGVISMSVYVAFKAKLYSVLLLGLGALPMLVFYMYKATSLFPDYATAVLYSRMAMVVLCSCLITALVFMCKVACNNGMDD